MNSRGFTLLECMLVLVLVALLLPPLSALFFTAQRIGNAGTGKFYGGIAAQNILESLRGRRLTDLRELIAEGVPPCDKYRYDIEWHGFVGMPGLDPQIYVVFCGVKADAKGYILTPGHDRPIFFDSFGDPETVSLWFTRTQGSITAKYLRHGTMHKKVINSPHVMGVSAVLTETTADLPAALHFSHPEYLKMPITFYDDASLYPMIDININGTSHAIRKKWYGADQDGNKWPVFPGDEAPIFYPLVTVRVFSLSCSETVLGRRTGILPARP